MMSYSPFKAVTPSSLSGTRTPKSKRRGASSTPRSPYDSFSSKRLASAPRGRLATPKIGKTSQSQAMQRCGLDNQKRRAEQDLVYIKQQGHNLIAGIVTHEENIRLIEGRQDEMLEERRVFENELEDERKSLKKQHYRLTEEKQQEQERRDMKDAEFWQQEAQLQHENAALEHKNAKFIEDFEKEKKELEGRHEAATRAVDSMERTLASVEIDERKAQRDIDELVEKKSYLDVEASDGKEGVETVTEEVGARLEFDAFEEYNAEANRQKRSLGSVKPERVKPFLEFVDFSKPSIGKIQDMTDLRNLSDLKDWDDEDIADMQDALDSEEKRNAGTGYSANPHFLALCDKGGELWERYCGENPKMMKPKKSHSLQFLKMRMAMQLSLVLDVDLSDDTLERQNSPEQAPSTKRRRLDY